MSNKILLLILFLIPFCSIVSTSSYLTQNFFAKYLKRFGKFYQGQEFARRLLIFEERLRVVLKFEQDYSQGISPVQLQINEYSDWVSIKFLQTNKKCMIL